MSSPSERIRQARETAGLEPAVVARAAGLSDHWYFDVESYDSDVMSNISLDQLLTIARAVGSTPLAILEGPERANSSHRVSLPQLAALARQRMVGAGLSVDEYSDLVGWRMETVFEDPEAIRGYTVDALQDICRDVGVDWRDALPTEINPRAG